MEEIGAAPGNEDSQPALVVERSAVRVPTDNTLPNRASSSEHHDALISRSNSRPNVGSRELASLLGDMTIARSQRQARQPHRGPALEPTAPSAATPQPETLPRGRVGIRELTSLMGDIHLERSQRQARRPSRSPSPAPTASADSHHRPCNGLVIGDRSETSTQRPAPEAHVDNRQPLSGPSHPSFISIDSNSVPSANPLTYLGMWVHSTGRMERKDGLKKFKTSVFFIADMWRQLRPKVASNLVSRLMFAYSMPVALYGCEISTATSFLEMDGAVNGFARIALSVLPSTRTSAMREFLGWRSPTLQGQYLRMLGAFRLLRAPAEGYHIASLLDQVLHDRQWLMDTITVLRQFGPTFSLFVQGLIQWADTNLPPDLAAQVKRVEGCQTARRHITTREASYEPQRSAQPGTSIAGGPSCTR